MPADICAAIDELVVALANFSRRVGRDVELTIDADGLFAVMVAEELAVRGEASSFEQAATFDTIEDVMAYLAMGEL
jgi:hypothetical protein